MTCATWTRWTLSLLIPCIGAAAQGQQPGGPPAGQPAPIFQPGAIVPGPVLQPAPTITITTLPPALPDVAIVACDQDNATAGSCGAFIVAGDYLLWQPIRQGQDYAVLSSGGGSGSFTSRFVNDTFDSGFRVAAGYRFPTDGLEVVLAYTYLRTTASDTSVAPEGGSIVPSLASPWAANQVMGAAANSTVNLNVIDLELAKRWLVSDTLGVRLFGGLRFADIDQKFTALYTGGDVSTDLVRRRVNFFGAGLRAGGEVDYTLCNRFGIYGRGAASLMTARFDSHLSETTDGTPGADVCEQITKMVPVMEMGAGISYQFGTLRLTAGYEFINWFGANEPIDFDDVAAPGRPTRRGGDLGFDGFVFRAEWMF